MGFGIVIPLLPLYAEEFGAGPVAITWLVAIYSLMQFFFAPWWGRLSDKRGRRPILLIGLVGSGLSYLGFGFAGSMAGLFVARALAGIAGANISVAQAYIADVTAPEDRAKGMGLIGAAFGLGFILGPAIGGLLTGFGASVPFFVAGTISLVNALLAWFWLPEPQKIGSTAGIEQSDLGHRISGLAGVLASRRLAPLYLAFFLITFAFAELEATMSIWADDQWAMSPAQVAWLFTYLGVVAAAVQGLLIGPLTRWLGEFRTLLIGSAALAAGLLMLPLAASPVVLAIALGAIATGQGMAVPSVSALISLNADSALQGQLLGFSQSLSALARVAGPVLGGILFARVDIGAPFLSGAAIIGCAMLAFLALYRRTPTSSQAK